MGSTRIRGKQLSLQINSIDYWADCTSCEMDSEDATDSTLTFEDVKNGGGTAKQFVFNITAIQSTDETSFWTMIWEHAGEIVPFTYAVWGNTEPTAAQPHFTGTVEIGPKPKLGGPAGNEDDYTFDTSWRIQGIPQRTPAVTTP